MEVILAKSAGFCFGVKRAVETVYEQTGTENRIYTYGPIIHNEEVVKDLESKGVTVLEGEEDLRKLDKGTVVIRSHGVSREICEMIEKKGLTCVDATCPFVKRGRGDHGMVTYACSCYRISRGGRKIHLFTG